MATSLSAPGTHSEQAERLRSLFAEISRELAVNRAALVEYSVLAPYHRIVVRPQRVVVPVVAQVEARPPVALVLLAGEQRLRRAAMRRELLRALYAPPPTECAVPPEFSR